MLQRPPPQSGSQFGHLGEQPFQALAERPRGRAGRQERAQPWQVLSRRGAQLWAVGRLPTWPAGHGGKEAHSRQLSAKGLPILCWLQKSTSQWKNSVQFSASRHLPRRRMWGFRVQDGVSAVGFWIPIPIQCQQPNTGLSRWNPELRCMGEGSAGAAAQHVGGWEHGAGAYAADCCCSREVHRVQRPLARAAQQG